MFPIPQRTRTGTFAGWDYVASEGRWEFTRVHTLNGGAQTVTLSLPPPFAVKPGVKVEYISASFTTSADAVSTNAKDVEWRMFSGISPTAYDILKTLTTDTGKSVVLYLTDLFFMKPQKLDIVFANSTNTDKAALKVVLQEA